MTELVVFYGLLSVAVIIGVGYSIHLYHKHVPKHDGNAHA